MRKQANQQSPGVHPQIWLKYPTRRLDDPLARRVLWTFLIAHLPQFVLTLSPRSETMPQWISRLSGTSAV